MRKKALRGLDERDVSELKRMLRHLRDNLADGSHRYPDSPAAAADPAADSPPGDKRESEGVSKLSLTPA